MKDWQKKISIGIGVGLSSENDFFTPFAAIS
jgi:hypothetical protein